MKHTPLGLHAHLISLHHSPEEIEGPQDSEEMEPLGISIRKCGDKAKMMKRFKMLQSINRCNAQLTKSGCCVESMEFRGLVRWVDTAPPRRSTHRGPGTKAGWGGCWKRLSWPQWDTCDTRVSQWTRRAMDYNTWKVLESMLIHEQGDWWGRWPERQR